jgi:hypothetical protein
MGKRRRRIILVLTSNLATAPRLAGSLDSEAQLRIMPTKSPLSQYDWALEYFGRWLGRTDLPREMVSHSHPAIEIFLYILMMSSLAHWGNQSDIVVPTINK